MRAAIIIGLNVFLIASVVAAPALKTPKNAEPVIVGDWQLLQLTQGGTAQGPSRLQYRFAADGSAQCVYENNGKVDQGTYTLDLKKTPHEIDITWTNNGNPLAHFKGIYRIVDNKLTIACVISKDAERPTEFTSLAGTSTVLIEFEKAAKK